MMDWFARPVLHVTDVEASLRFYVDRLGFTSPWVTTRIAERTSQRSTQHLFQVETVSHGKDAISNCRA
jgi:hypothetical protein